MKRGSLEARVSRLEGTQAGVCDVCEGRSGPIGVYVEGEDGIRRDSDGRPMPAGVPAWTCAGCGRTYARTPIVICVEGRSKSLRDGLPPADRKLTDQLAARVLAHGTSAGE